MADRWLRAGEVARAHGLDGSFYVARPVAGLLEEGMSVVIAGSTRRIVRRAGAEQRPIVRVEGCEDREAARALAGEEIRVARAKAPELGADEWWAEDLQGAAVHDGEAPVGTVRRLLALPSCEVLEVARGDGQEELLVPLVSDAVRSVDLKAGRIDIDLRFLGER